MPVFQSDSARAILTPRTGFPFSSHRCSQQVGFPDPPADVNAEGVSLRSPASRSAPWRRGCETPSGFVSHGTSIPGVALRLPRAVMCYAFGVKAGQRRRRLTTQPRVAQRTLGTRRRAFGKPRRGFTTGPRPSRPRAKRPTRPAPARNAEYRSAASCKTPSGFVPCGTSIPGVALRLPRAVMCYAFGVRSVQGC